MAKRYLTVLLVVFSFTSRMAAQTPEEELQQIFTVNNLMGMSVVAVYQGEIIFSHHLGLSNFASQTPVTSRTHYRIASISKAVTATAFMQLYEQGLVGLDDNISEILGYTINNPHHPGIAITPRMLLTHTSGLMDGTTYGGFLGTTYNNANPPALQQLLVLGGSFYSAGNWLNVAPGTYFRYTNLGYGVLASVIEKISDTRFDVFVRQNILQPLGISGSFNIHDLNDPSNLAVLYRMSCGIWAPQADNYPSGLPAPIDYSGYVPGHNGFIFGPQGGLRISAEDLSVFMSMLMNMGSYKGIQILEPQTVELMTGIQWQYNGSNGNNYYNLFNAWGLGLQITTNQENGDIVVPGYSMIGHAGEAYGLISDMYYHKNPDFGIIFVTNGSAGDYYYGWNSAFYEVEEQIFDLLYNDIIVPAMAEPEEPQYFDVEIRSQGMGTTDPATGTYSLQQGQTLTVVADPFPGWKLDSIVINGNSFHQNTMQIEVEEDLDVLVVFTQIDTSLPLAEEQDKVSSWLRQPDQHLQISIPGGKKGDWVVEVFSVSGMRLLQYQFLANNSTEISLDVSFLPASFYVLQVKNATKQVHVNKFFIPEKP